MAHRLVRNVEGSLHAPVCTQNYGWAASAACGALVVGLLTALLPEGLTRRIWLGWLWVIPVFAMVACIYLTMPWFRL
jgi:hypothetical protein